MSHAIRKIRRLGRRVGLQGDWHLYLLAAGIGLLMGVVATLFLAPLRAAEAQDVTQTGVRRSRGHHPSDDELP